MHSHKDLIHEEEWDHLIVLDSCRYDHLKHYYSKFPNIQGEIRKARSEGSNTLEVANNTFTQSYDARVYTGDILGCFKSPIASKIQTFIPRVIYDSVLSMALSYEFDFKNVEAGALSKGVRQVVDNRNKSGQNIFWFTEPHTPSIGQLEKGSSDNLTVARESGCQERNNALAESLRQVYAYDLRQVLLKVSRLIHYLEGRIVVTADHGQAFGEEGEFGHPHGSSNPVLRTVPWLEIDNSVETVDYRDVTNGRYVDLVFENVLERRRSEQEDEYVRHLETGKLNREQVFNRVFDSEEHCRNNECVQSKLSQTSYF